MLLLLVRHGLTDLTGIRLAGWLPGVHLSEEGRRQADGLVERLAGLRLAAIYSSPIDRCVETAQPTAAARRMRIRTDPALGEVRYGAWEGKRLKTLAATKMWETVRHRPSAVRFPGGETLREVQARAVDAVERLAREHRRGFVAAFTHADPIRLLVAHFVGVHLDLFQRIVVSPASVTALWLGKGTPTVLTVNHTGSLGELVGGRR